MAAFPEISTGIVTGRFLAGDGPDAAPLGGTIRFTPTARVVLVPGAAPPTTLFPQPVEVTLSATGTFTEEMWATDDADGNPVDWLWKAEFALTLGTMRVAREPFYFTLPAGTTVDLTLAAPLTYSNGVVITTGPQGEKGDKGDKGDTGSQGVQGIQGIQGVKGDTGSQGIPGQSVQVFVVPSASWPPAADPNPLHFYVRTP